MLPSLVLQDGRILPVLHRSKVCKVRWARPKAELRKLCLMIIEIHLMKSTKASCGLRLKVIRASCELIHIRFLI